VAVLLVAIASRADRLLGDLQHLRTFSSGCELLGKFLGLRLTADLVPHLRLVRTSLLMVSIMCTGCGGPRLVGDRARDGLTDPPRA